MRKLFTIFSISALFFLTGCIDIFTGIELNKDGTGTVTERVLISGEVVQMLKEFSAAFSDSGSTAEEEFALFKEEEMRSKASSMGQGVTYVSGERIEDNGREGFTAEYKFEDINMLSINQNPENFMPAMGDEFVPEPDEKSGILSFKFNKGETAVLRIIIPSDKDTSGRDENIEAGSVSDSLGSDSLQYEQLKELIKDMRMIIQLKVNGEIVETNASFVNGSEVGLFEIDFHELFDHPEAFERFKELNGMDVKNVEEVLKSIPGIKIEMGPEVTVKFK